SLLLYLRATGLASQRFTVAGDRRKSTGAAGFMVGDGTKRTGACGFTCRSPACWRPGAPDGTRPRTEARWRFSRPFPQLAEAPESAPQSQKLEPSGTPTPALSLEASPFKPGTLRSKQKASPQRGPGPGAQAPEPRR